METLHRIWETWKRVGQVIGDFIARIVLTLFYFTVFLPFGLGARLFSDRLALKERVATWSERTTGDLTFDDARRLT